MDSPRSSSVNPAEPTGGDDSIEPTAGSPTSRTQLFFVLALAAVPWSVQVFSTGDITLLFAWGLVNTNPTNVTTLWDFLFRLTMGLPDYILAWPLGVGCYLVAVVSAAVGAVTGRGDVRVTAVALLLAGLTQLELARGFSVQPDRVAWPLGTVVLWAVAGYLFYRDRVDKAE